MDVIDLHDLATILLRERLLTEPRFKRCHLREINDGSRPISCLPAHVRLPGLDSIPRGIARTAYFLEEDISGWQVDAIEPTAFRHPEFTSTSAVSATELETAFWGCKHHDSGYVLAHAMQLVLDALPKNTKLRARTSRGHAMVCDVRAFTVAEVPITARAVTYICKLTKRPDLGPSKLGMEQFITGVDGAELPWVYLVFGGADVAREDLDRDGRVMLDLVAPMLGMRGLGGEIFAMERVEDYHERVLPHGGDEGEQLTLSGRINPSVPAEASHQLSERVLRRLHRIAEGREAFCSYCGKVPPASQCSKCRKARYCGPACQTNAWKYHKTWCKVDMEAK